MKSIIFILIGCLLTLSVNAQHAHQEPEKAAKLLPGLGTQHHPVSTTNAEAQRFFDQGLTLVYAFNHEEAARSFQHAADLDKSLAMAYWGIALAVGPNYNLDVDPEREKIAYNAIQKALELANQPRAKATVAERAYIDAMATRYSNDPKPDFKKLALDYKNAMGGVHRQFPDDLDAATLYAESMMNLRPWQLWTNDGKPAEDTEEIIAVLESVIKRDPNHIGAVHYYIHAVEASPHLERALAVAPTLPKLTPAAGHLVHMPAHIYMRTGDYAAAAQSNIDAAAADEAYIKSSGAQGVYPMMYYSHNLDFLQSALCMSGQYSAALRATSRLEANIAPIVKEMPMVEGAMATRFLIQARFYRWDELINSRPPDKSLLVANAIWFYARGLAYARTGNVEAAQGELNNLRARAKAIEPDTPWGNNTARSILDLAARVLGARIAQARKETKTALDLFALAIAQEDALVYDEPPPWSAPVREGLGGFLYQTGDYVAAEKAFRDDLARHPKSGRSLFGLAECLKAQGKKAEAAAVQKEFEAAWKDADTRLRMEDL